MSISYTKLRDGSWGIRSTESVKTGQTVTVTKANGETKTETVGKIIWSKDGIILATIVKQLASQSRPSRSSCRLSDDDRCEVCNGNKWTCGHCVGW